MTIRAEQDLKAGKELPITIEKNIANSQGKMVPMKVGVCMIGLGANFRAGSGSKTSAEKMSLTEAKAADEKLEGESVNKVLLLSSIWIVSSGYLPAFVNVCFTQQTRRRTRNKFTTHAGADGGVGRLQQHAD